QRRVDYPEVRPRLLDGHGRLEPADRTGVSAIATQFVRRRHREWQPQVAAIRNVERRRQHADDCVRTTVQRYALADEPAVRSETPLPQSVAQQRHEIPAYDFFLDSEVAPDNRMQTERRKQIRRHERP